MLEKCKVDLCTHIQEQSIVLIHTFVTHLSIAQRGDPKFQLVKFALVQRKSALERRLMGLGFRV